MFGTFLMFLSVSDFVSDNNIAEVSPVECNDSKTLLNLETQRMTDNIIKGGTEMGIYSRE